MRVQTAQPYSCGRGFIPTPDASAASALGAREETAIAPRVTHHTDTKLQLPASMILEVFSYLTDSIKGE